MCLEFTVPYAFNFLHIKHDIMCFLNREPDSNPRNLIELVKNMLFKNSVVSFHGSHHHEKMSIFSETLTQLCLKFILQIDCCCSICKQTGRPIPWPSHLLIICHDLYCRLFGYINFFFFSSLLATYITLIIHANKTL